MAGGPHSSTLPHITLAAYRERIEAFRKIAEQQIIGNLMKMKCPSTREDIMLLSGQI